MNDKWERSKLPDVLGGEILGVEFEFFHGKISCRLPSGGLVESALCIGEGIRENGTGNLGVAQFTPVKAGGLLESGGAALVSPLVWAGSELGVDDADRLSHLIPNHAYGSQEIGISADDNGGLETVPESIKEQVGGEVHIRSFFLGIEDLDGAGRRLDDFHALWPAAEIPLNDFKVGDGAEGTPVDLLAGGSVGVSW